MQRALLRRLKLSLMAQSTKSAATTEGCCCLLALPYCCPLAIIVVVFSKCPWHCFHRGSRGTYVNIETNAEVNSAT